MALKVLNSAGDGSWADVADAIVYAADNGARVINMSFGDEKSSQTIEMAVDYARDQGCLMVAAAGNGGLSVLYPAALEDVLAVAATNNQDLPWTFGNQGPEIGIAAPGVDVFSTNALGSYTTLSGTSMSAPHVSGVASLIWSLRPDYSAIDVTQVLTTTAVDVWSPGFDPLTGWGRVNASTAIETVSSTLAYLPLVNSVGKTDKEKIYIPLLVMDHK
jgi:serine protease